MDKLVNVSILRNCQLWASSNLRIDFMYGGLKRSKLQEFIERMEEMGPEEHLTDAEQDLLNAARKTIQMMES